MALCLSVILNLTDIHAQNHTDTLVLETFTIEENHATKSNLFDYQVDSLNRQLFSLQSVTSNWAFQFPIYIKNYGAGNSATFSYRGMNASYSLVKWKDIPINSSMNGTADLSLLQTGLVNQIAFRNGDFYLDEQPIHPDQPATFKWSNALFTDNILASQWDFILPTKNQQTHQIQFAHQRIEPALPFKPPFPDRQFQNINLKYDYHLNCKACGISVWWTSLNRSLLPSIFQSQIQEQQMDRSLKVNGRYAINLGDKVTWQQNIAYIRDFLRYENFQLAIDDTSQMQNVYYLQEFKVGLGNALLWRVNANLSYHQAFVHHYQNPQEQWRAALKLHIDYHPVEMWRLQLGIQQRQINQIRVPTLPYLQVNWQAGKDWHFRAMLQKKYRHPSLNDLHWIPDLSIELLGESGWEQELGIQWSKNLPEKTLKWNIQVNAFHILRNNWISWLPNGSRWEPNNLKQVRSRGMELQMQLNKQWQAFELNGNGQLSWTKATHQKAAFPNDAALGKQLIYIPVVQAGMSWQLLWTKQYFLQWMINASSQRFTSSDNRNALPAYQVQHFFIGSQYLLYNKFEIQNKIGCYNLWNAHYELVANRALTSRRFEWAFTLKI